MAHSRLKGVNTLFITAANLGLPWSSITLLDVGLVDGRAVLKLPPESPAPFKAANLKIFRNG